MTRRVPQDDDRYCGVCDRLFDHRAGVLHTLDAKHPTVRESLEARVLVEAASAAIGRGMAKRREATSK